MCTIDIEKSRVTDQLLIYFIRWIPNKWRKVINTNFLKTRTDTQSWKSKIQLSNCRWNKNNSKCIRLYAIRHLSNFLLNIITNKAGHDYRHPQPPLDTSRTPLNRTARNRKAKRDYRIVAFECAPSRQWPDASRGDLWRWWLRAEESVCAYERAAPQIIYRFIFARVYCLRLHMRESWVNSNYFEG